jgi:hypothetical protein
LFIKCDNTASSRLTVPGLVRRVAASDVASIDTLACLASAVPAAPSRLLLADFLVALDVERAHLGQWKLAKERHYMQRKPPAFHPQILAALQLETLKVF